MAKSTNATRVETYLSKNDWRFQKEKGNTGTLRMGFVLQGFAFDLIIQDAAKQEVLLFLTPHIAFVPKHRKRDFAELLAELNYGLILGTYEMDPEDGELRLKIGVPTDQNAITEGQIEHCMRVLLSILSNSFPRIAAFLASESTKRKHKPSKEASHPKLRRTKAD
jgi:hypothetical protein